MRLPIQFNNSTTYMKDKTVLDKNQVNIIMKSLLQHYLFFIWWYWIRPYVQQLWCGRCAFANTRAFVLFCDFAVSYVHAFHNLYSWLTMAFRLKYFMICSSSLLQQRLESSGNFKHTRIRNLYRFNFVNVVSSLRFKSHRIGNISTTTKKSH